jgi:hypothetical protein
LIPQNIKLLLGLGLNFCIQPPKFNNLANLDLTRFRRDLLLKTYFAGTQSFSEKQHNKLYVKSEWWPPLKDIPTSCQTRIDKTLEHLKQQIPDRTICGNSNLSSFQRTLLHTLMDHPTIMVMKSDKNMGPAIIDKVQYVTQALTEHLLDDNTYQRIHETAATYHIKQLTEKISSFIEHNFPCKSQDAIFLQRSLDKVSDPFAYFYLLAKVHKNPCTTRPIVSVSGSLLEGLGKWTDMQLQKICQEMPFICKSSYCVTDAISKLLINNSKSMHDIKIFTTDAVSMYTNIDTIHALTVIKTFLTRTKPDICQSHNICVDTLLDALNLLMTSTTFKFGDTFWLQETGTAMGSPAAPMYATLYFAIHEMDIIPRFPNLIFYGRYIDDAIGIWYDNDNDLHTSHQNDQVITFTELQRQFNSFGQLQWIFTPLLKEINFLDITIKITDTTISICPYEKLLNLYLYIPPTSAHPPNGLLSLICGRIVHIKRITTCKAQLKSYLFKLRRRLCARGFSVNYVNKMFQKALDKTELIKKHTYNEMTDIRPTTPVYLHYIHHPKNLPIPKIHSILNNVMLNPEDDVPFSDLKSKEGIPINITKVMVVNHRPRNLSHFLTPRKFFTSYSIKTHLQSLKFANVEQQTVNILNRKRPSSNNLVLHQNKKVCFNPSK